MPQLDILTFIYQILNTIIFFSIFYYLISFYVLPSIFFVIWIRNSLSLDVYNIFKINIIKKKKIIHLFFFKLITFLFFCEHFIRKFKEYDLNFFFSYLYKTFLEKKNFHNFLLYANKRVLINNNIYLNML